MARKYEYMSGKFDKVAGKQAVLSGQCTPSLHAISRCGAGATPGEQHITNHYSTTSLGNGLALLQR